MKPLGSELSLCVIECELASCEFLVEQMLGFRGESALRPELKSSWSLRFW